MDKILIEIKQAEAEARRIAEASKKESERAILEAKAAADKSCKRELDELSKKEHALFGKKEDEWKKEKHDLLKEAEKKAEELENKSKRNMKLAAGMVLRLFEDGINASD